MLKKTWYRASARTTENTPEMENMAEPMGTIARFHRNSGSTMWRTE